MVAEAAAVVEEEVVVVGAGPWAVAFPPGGVVEEEVEVGVSTACPLGIEGVTPCPRPAEITTT